MLASIQSDLIVFKGELLTVIHGSRMRSMQGPKGPTSVCLSFPTALAGRLTWALARARIPVSPARKNCTRDGEVKQLRFLEQYARLCGLGLHDVLLDALTSTTQETALTGSISLYTGTSRVGHLQASSGKISRYC